MSEKIGIDSDRRKKGKAKRQKTAAATPWPAEEESEEAEEVEEAEEGNEAEEVEEAKEEAGWGKVGEEYYLTAHLVLYELVLFVCRFVVIVLV